MKGYVTEPLGTYIFNCQNYVCHYVSLCILMYFFLSPLVLLGMEFHDKERYQIKGYNGDEETF